MTPPLSQPLTPERRTLLHTAFRPPPLALLYLPFAKNNIHQHSSSRSLFQHPFHSPAISPPPRSFYEHRSLRDPSRPLPFHLLPHHAHSASPPVLLPPFIHCPWSNGPSLPNPFPPPSPRPPPHHSHFLHHHTRLRSICAVSNCTPGATGIIFITILSSHSEQHNPPLPSHSPHKTRRCTRRPPARILFLCHVTPPSSPPMRSAASYRCVVPCSALFVRVHSCCQ